MAGEAASMSLLYKGEIEEDSEFTVMVFTNEIENDIDPLNMQLSYKLYGYDVEVTNNLPNCALGNSAIDD